MESARGSVVVRPTMPCTCVLRSRTRSTASWISPMRFTSRFAIESRSTSTAAGIGGEARILPHLEGLRLHDVADRETDLIATREHLRARSAGAPKSTMFGSEVGASRRRSQLKLLSPRVRVRRGPPPPGPPGPRSARHRGGTSRVGADHCTACVEELERRPSPSESGAVARRKWTVAPVGGLRPTR